MIGKSLGHYVSLRQTANFLFKLSLRLLCECPARKEIQYVS
jgi:hypothetical protein